jgi:hypothetical protein
MGSGRTLLLAVDVLDEQDLAGCAHAGQRSSGPLQSLMSAATTLRIRPGGPSEPTPALASLVTGASVAHTGVATDLPFDPEHPESRSTWYADATAVPTLFEDAHRAGLTTAALQWPATAGADIDLCLPLVEDLRRYRNRWDMAERTSSPRMVAEHLAPRRALGVQLSQVVPDELVTEIAVEALGSGGIDLLAVRLSGLGIARRAAGLGTAAAHRALQDVADAITRILTAFSPRPADRVLLVPGRTLVPTALLVHPNAVLAAEGMLRTEGTRMLDFRALVWPDGPRGVVHVRRGEGRAARDLVLHALTGVAAHSRLRLRPVDDGVGATARTDVVAVLEGTPGTVFGLSATHRPLVDGEDPYYAGPRAVTDPSAPAAALALGPGLPPAPVQGSWAAAMGLTLPGATATGMCPAAVPRR